MKMNKGKTSVTALLIMAIILLTGWTSVTLLAQKSIHSSLSPAGDMQLVPNGVHIKGLAWQVYLKLMEAGRRSLHDPARPVQVKSIFTIMNL